MHTDLDKKKPALHACIGVQKVHFLKDAIELSRQHDRPGSMCAYAIHNTETAATSCNAVATSCMPKIKAQRCFRTSAKLFCKSRGKLQVTASARFCKHEC